MLTFGDSTATDSETLVIRYSSLNALMSPKIKMKTSQFLAVLLSKYYVDFVSGKLFTLAKSRLQHSEDSPFFTLYNVHMHTVHMM